MNTEKKQLVPDSGLMTVQFSISAKLITIITIIVLVSLGSITALVSWLVREDLRIAAEDNNFEVNRRSAMETETTLTNARSNSRILMQTVNVLGAGTAPAEQAVGMFFEENRQIALLLFAADGKAEDLLVNKQFFLSKEIDTALADSFFTNNRAAFVRAASGETVLLNMTPWFNTSLLAMLYPWNNGVIGVVFSPENLTDNFGFGTNQSYLINDAGDILVHVNFELMKSGTNVAGEKFIQHIWENPQRNEQTLYTDEEGIRYFGAFTKLNIGGAVVITRIESNKVFEGINATTRRNIYLTITVLSISIMLIWFFAKSISIPIKTLAQAAHTIESGAFEVELQPKGRDEIGVLTASFQRMSMALGVFGRFTNRDIAVRAMRGEIKPGGSPKHATVFFSDMRGFTEKSENFTLAFGEDASNLIILWLNDYLTRMVECVEKTFGVVDKFIGDAVMAHWGTAYTAGSPQEDAYNCLKTALMMRIALFQMNKHRSPEDPSNPPIRIGCGIDTGIVTAGQIGSELRMEYTVVGDTVNLAYRTESLNKPLATDILITENTWKLVKDYFITEEMPSVRVRGKKLPIRIFAVINFAGIDKGPRTLADLRKLLGIEAPDMSKLDLNAYEQNYNTGGKV